MTKPVDHEITLIAYGIDPVTGLNVVVDIVETSRHFASHHMRRFIRNPSVRSVSATSPNSYLDNAARSIRREFPAKSFETIACNAFDKALGDTDLDNDPERWDTLVNAHNARMVAITTRNNKR